MGDATIIDIQKPVRWKTADVRKIHRIKLPDVVIAATAIVYNATLLSRNVSDFRSLSGLGLINPRDGQVLKLPTDLS